MCERCAGAKHRLRFLRGATGEGLAGRRAGGVGSRLGPGPGPAGRCHEVVLLTVVSVSRLCSCLSDVIIKQLVRLKGRGACPFCKGLREQSPELEISLL